METTILLQLQSGETLGYTSINPGLPLSQLRQRIQQAQLSVPQSYEFTFPILVSGTPTHVPISGRQEVDTTVDGYWALGREAGGGSGGVVVIRANIGTPPIPVGYADGLKAAPPSYGQAGRPSTEAMLGGGYTYQQGMGTSIQMQQMQQMQQQAITSAMGMIGIQAPFQGSKVSEDPEPNLAKGPRSVPFSVII